jgi:hypothetical protein
MLPCELMNADAKSELLEAAQHDLMKHHWDTFCTQPLSIAQGGTGVIVPGCVHCHENWDLFRTRTDVGCSDGHE